MFCFVFMYFFPPGVYVGTLNLIASIPGPSLVTLQYKFRVRKVYVSWTSFPDVWNCPATPRFVWWHHVAMTKR